MARSIFVNRQRLIKHGGSLKHIWTNNVRIDIGPGLCLTLEKSVGPNDWNELRQTEERKTTTRGMRAGTR